MALSTERMMENNVSKMGGEYSSSCEMKCHVTLFGTPSESGSALTLETGEPMRGKRHLKKANSSNVGGT
jgi:hypothetical protein